MGKRTSGKEHKVKVREFLKKYEKRDGFRFEDLFADLPGKLRLHYKLQRSLNWLIDDGVLDYNEKGFKVYSCK